jgi:hypothetical protein
MEELKRLWSELTEDQKLTCLEKLEIEYKQVREPVALE